MIADLFEDYTPLSDLPTLNEVVSKYGSMESLLSLTSHPNIDGSRLWSMILARFGEWRLFRTIDSEEDYKILEERFSAYYARYCYYYDEYLKAYNTTVDMLDGRKTVIAYDTTNTRQEGGSDSTKYSGNSKSSSNSESKYYDLPRQSTSENRPSTSQDGTAGDESSSSSTNETAYGHTDSSKRGGTVTRTGDADVIDLKKRYLQLIQDVYYEFASRFEPLFVPMHGD